MKKRDKKIIMKKWTKRKRNVRMKKKHEGGEKKHEVNPIRVWFLFYIYSFRYIPSKCGHMFRRYKSWAIERIIYVAYTKYAYLSCQHLKKPTVFTDKTTTPTNLDKSFYRMMKLIRPNHKSIISRAGFLARLPLYLCFPFGHCR